MSRESDIHNLIEQQNCERKQSLWEDRIKYSIQLDNEDLVGTSGRALVVNKKRKIIALSIIVFLLIAVLIIVFSIIYGRPSKFRYCTSSDYTTDFYDNTLKEYSQQSNGELLYLNWYTEAFYYEDYIYKLKKNDEIICFEEEIIDLTTANKVNIFVTDNYTTIDFLEEIKDICFQNAKINNVEIHWGENSSEGSAYFEYNSYVYYLMLTNATDFSILGLVDLFLAG